MKKIIWLVTSSDDGQLSASIHTSQADAETEARRLYKIDWDAYGIESDDGLMPDNLQDICEAFDESGVSYIDLDVLHFTIETDDLANA